MTGLTCSTGSTLTARSSAVNRYDLSDLMAAGFWSCQRTAASGLLVHEHTDEHGESDAYGSTDPEALAQVAGRGHASAG